MAKVIEQIIAVKVTKIVKDTDQRDFVLDDDQLATLHASIPELAESVIDDPTIIVEIVEVM